VGGESNDEIRRLRSQARDLDVSIRLQRASRSSGSRTYDLVDRSTGAVIHAGIALGEIPERLASIPLDPATATIGQPALERQAHERAHGERCPMCGTQRIAFFRWCKKCGFDFEVVEKAGYHGGWTTDGYPSPPAPRSRVLVPDREGPIRRSIEAGVQAGRWIRSRPWPELLLAGFIGLLIGGVIAIALAR